MKLFIFLLVITSLSASADTKGIVKLSSENNRITFEANPYSKVLYMAANPTCIEMRSSHALPYPAAKEKLGRIEIKDDEISFIKRLGGFCNYKYANANLELSLDRTHSANLTLFSSKDADSEIDLICSVSDKRLMCRVQGEAESTTSIRLYVNLSEITKINVTLE